MKTLYKIIAVLAVLVLVCTGCYGDKGNYDYKDINELTITFDKSSIFATVGDVVEVTSTITFKNGTGDMERLKFKWYLADGYTREDWDKQNFKWEIDRLVENMSLRLEVTDPVTGLVYIKKLSLRIKSRYERDGILILSEKDGRTQFSYVKAAKTRSDGDFYHVLEVEEFVDAYNMENGEDLPAEPLQLHQHFCQSVSAESILAMTKNGVVDMSGLDFKKAAVLEEKFENNAYPAGCDYLAEAAFMRRISLVTDPEGHVYRRLKNTDELFHSGEFLHRRMTMNGEELAGCRLIHGRFDKLRGTLVYEKSKERLLVITDTEAGDYNDADDASAGFPVSILDADTPPEGFVQPSDMSGIDLISLEHGWVQSASGKELDYTMVFGRDGKIFCQNFSVSKEWSAVLFSVMSPEIGEVKGLPGAPTCVYPSCYPEANGLVFIAVGKRLFLYDRANPELPVVEWGEFRADVVSMDGDVYRGRWLSVGLSDGSVLLLNAMKCNNPNNRYVYYDSLREMVKMPDLPATDDEQTPEEPSEPLPPVNYGNIVDVCLKLTASSGWR